MADEKGRAARSQTIFHEQHALPGLELAPDASSAEFLHNFLIYLFQISIRRTCSCQTQTQAKPRRHSVSFEFSVQSTGTRVEQSRGEKIPEFTSREITY